MQARQFHDAIGNWSEPLPHRRMAVYRNNVAVGLVTALKVRFPVTEQLVGTEFFSAMALAYAEGERPSNAVLINYGSGFADFIRGFEPARTIAYLADVAALESLWWRAYHAADATPLQAAALEGIEAEALGGLHFTFHPSAGVMRSPFAAGSIWQAHHGGPVMSSLNIEDAECILVRRPFAEVCVSLIRPERFTFLHELQHGASLADAVDAALDLCPGFDIATELAAFFAADLATGFSL